MGWNGKGKEAAERREGEGEGKERVRQEEGGQGKRREERGWQWKERGGKVSIPNFNDTPLPLLYCTEEQK